MNYAFYFLAIIGAIVLLLVAIGAIVTACGELWDWLQKPNQRSFFEGQEFVRNRLRNDAWWFSESPETMQLVSNLASGMHVSEARERWRKAREAKSLADEGERE